ncbi:iron uptake protein [Lysobacter aestuarii]|uniref:Iron uptake protein n=1 Tax=Marilutibacter aestuarii TaxID=1706195 RepID=A0A507ZTV4_9GAMM|nr:iron uptake protein [Lysobacter aestuarii]
MLRVATALLGGYAFAWGFIAATAATLFAAGMGFHDAEFLASALGLLGFVAVFLWAIATPRPVRFAAGLVATALAMSALASTVQAVLA